MPGTLVNCRNCTRSFHALCHRKVPERPNYTQPSRKLQKNRIPTFSSDTDNTDDESAVENETLAVTTEDNDTDGRATSSLQQEATTQNRWTPLGEESALEMSQESEGKPVLLEVDTKTKLEVVCMGEVRPASKRKRANNATNVSYKNELPPEEDDGDLELCTCCRLLKSGLVHNPPNIKSDELCHLIKFTFNHNRSWVGILDL